MPMMFGAFETSLRGGDSPSTERKVKLHKGCCGSLHGHGVKKEKSVRDVVPASRSCSLVYSVNESNFENSSSEGDDRSPRVSVSPLLPLISHLKISPTNSATYTPHGRGSITPDLLLGSGYRSSHSSNVPSRRSQSTDFTNVNGSSNILRANGADSNGFIKRSASCTGGGEGSDNMNDSSDPSSSNKAIANRLYNSLTKSSAGKRRAERSASDSKRIARAMSAQQPRPSSSLDKPSCFKSKSLTRADYNEDSGTFSSLNSDSDEKYDVSCLDGTTVQDLVEASVTPTQEERRQSLIHGISDDELAPTEELRRRKRLERRQVQHQQHLSGKFTTGGSDISPNNNTNHRRQSPSPRPKVRINRGNNMERGRRGSEEDETGSSSGSDISPPSSPSPTQYNNRSASLRPWSNTNRTTTSVNLSARRTKSSGVGSNSKIPVGFGSSVSRFSDAKATNENSYISGNILSNTDIHVMRNRVNSANSSGIKSYFTSIKSPQTLAKTNSSEGYPSTPGNQKSFGPSLSRTSSNESSNPAHSKTTSRHNVVNGKLKSNTINRSNGNVNQNTSIQGKCSMQEVAEAWLRFKDDIEDAMELKKPNSGFYKNLSDMMHTKMKMLDQAKSEEQLASEKAFLEAERVWLVHRDGFASAGLLKKSKDGEGNEEATSDGKVRVQLDYNGDIIEVDEDDVEKANPPSFDKVEDLAQLRFLNESSVLHTLRQRFGNQLTHTFAGPTIISINPMSPLAIYSDKVIQMFKECKLEDMPPHIYSVAQTAFRAMLHTRRDQSIALVGRSGSGKTTNIRHILNYYATIASSTSLSASSPAPLFTQEKVSALFCLLEAFGNARTVMNSNASRFSQLVSLDFDNSGVIVSVSIQAMMLEKTRVVRRPSGEPNFNIFYQMLAGLDIKQRRDLHLDNLNEPNLFMTPLQRTEDRTKAANAWERIIASTKVLGIHPNEALGLWSVLAAIYHLGVASVSRSNTGKPQFGRAQAAQRASLCLGTTVEDLTRLIFSEGGRRSVSSLSPLNQQTSNRKVKQNDGGNPPDGGMEALEGFVVGLYQEAFNAVLYLINRSITTTNNANTSILLLDTPGFQNAATVLNSGNKNAVFNGASFEDLCHNYTQERLQMLFHDRTITTLHENYLREQIDIDGIIGDGDLATPAPLVSLVDKQVGVRAPGGDAESVEKRGLLWLLDEEAIYPGATDQSFVERLLLQSQDTGRRSSTADRRRQSLSPGNPSAPDRAPIGDNLLLSKGPGESHFILHHFQGTNPVLYNAHGWLQASREDPAVRSASNQLQESNVKFISELFGKSRALGTSSVSGSVAGLEGSHALRRVSSMRRAFTSGAAGIKRHSVALQIKFQVDGICEQLRRTRLHFVHCFIPQHNAGICDIKGASSQTNNATPSNGTLDGNNEILMNVPLVRSQLRGAQILDVVRLHKNGFPENMTFGEFWRKYKVLLESANSLSANLPVDKVRSAVQDLLEELDLDKTAVRLGNTQVFLRSGVLAHLNEERDEKVTDQVVRFQAICRGHLARRRIQKLKTQDIAIRCIQKNVRKFMGVRGWPWWRLLIKITPMLNVHRTEDMLKSKLEELETLRTRLEKVEKERTEFKQTNDKLESRLSEMTADLGEEHSAATLATERLENEQAERMKLQKDNSELQGRSKQLQSANDRMEMELMYSRGMDSMNGGEGYEGLDEGEHASIFKQKYERAAKELDYTKKRLQQQHEDDMEQLVALKKQLEKKLNDAYEEVDEQRQVVAQWKRKTAKVQGEQNDLRMLLEEQTSRNALLEKRARKFDTELGLVNEERKAELQSKEKFQKEVDQLKSIKNSLEDHIQAMKLDLDFKEEKIGALNQELEELSAGGGASEEEVSSLKRQKHDLEMRLKDQEEELDDLAGQVQIFEAAKTKLEMSMAAQKKEHRRELSAKDDELEDARTSTQKKVKVLEQQLESEHEERINFMREKHELETKIINLQELANRSADEEQVAKLKKDLKRTKALLKDAQLMIEKSRNESSNKVVLRQLKNQLEDTEFARMAAVKAKQNVELEVADLQLQLDDVCRNKSDLEDKMLKINREKADMSSQLEDNEEEMSDVMKKYKASVSQLSVDQITIQQQASQVTDLEEERNKLKEQLAEFAQKIESLEGDNVSTAQHQRLELKIKELESKLELEKTTRGRMETQITRLKEGIEKINHECDSLRVKEATSQDQARRLQRQLRDLKENYTTLQQKETEVNAKKNEYEKKLELAEAETVTARNDLKLALKRVEDLQQAINGELDSDLDSLNSDADSDSSDELIGATFMDHHNRAISVQRERESIARDISARESIQREVRASIARDSVVRQLQTMPEEPELKMSELMSNKRINEGDNDSSSEEDNEDNNTTQQREDSVQQNSIDGTIEESQA